MRLRSRNPGPPPEDVMARPADVLNPAELARAETWRDRWGATGQQHNRRPRRAYEVEPSREAVIEFQSRHVYDWLRWLRKRRVDGEDS